ncbi:cytochrome P450 [Flagelloscypha sp. PMI_526]|nr:cytochrome P450 [Flagelloscypha sp. PMI_526]
MASLQTVGYLALGLSSVWFVKRAHYVYFTLTDIPTIGTFWFLFYLCWYQEFCDGASIQARGRLSQGTYFHHPTPLLPAQQQISGDKMISDIQKSKDEVLSFLDNALDLTQAEFQVPDKEMARDMYHTQIVKTTLTRNISARFEDVRDEINTACAEHMPCGDEWASVTVLPAMMKIISRGANRFFLGLDFCRNYELLDIFVDFTVRHVTNGIFLRIFPKSMRRIVAKYLLRSDSYQERAMEIMEPTIRYRLEQEEKYGPNWEGKPVNISIDIDASKTNCSKNDFISWLLAIATGPQRDVYDIVYRIVGINFAAIHTTSHSLTHALFDLGANPQYIQPLRDEIEAIMKRLDSFAKESQRFWGISPCHVRSAGFEGIHILEWSKDPSLAMISKSLPDLFIQMMSIMNRLTSSSHGASLTFETEEGEGVFHQFVTPDRSFVAFGIPGKHSCPGRFFAATEIKQALAYFVMNYDMKFEDEGVRPPNMVMGPAISPNGSAKMLFRKRRV